MREVLVSLESWDYSKAIEIGLEGEVEAVAVIFDISSWMRWYGNGIVTLIHTQKGKNFPYPCTIETNRNRVKWLIQPADLTIDPFGECQLIYTVGKKTVAKSKKFQTRVYRSLGEQLTDPPDPKMLWTDKVTSACEQAENAAEQAKNAIEQLQDAFHSAQQQISNAQSQAVEAVKSVADEKIEQMEKLETILPSVTEDDNGKILTVVDGKWSALAPLAESWVDIQMLVRARAAPKYFPVGYEFTTYDSTENTDIVWRVVGYDTIKAADKSLKHTMILAAKYVYSNASGNQIPLQFDASEALYYAEAGLQAGTYNFTLLDGYDTAYGGGKTYSFTLTKPVPVGGVIMFPWGSGQQANTIKISTYTTKSDISALETVGVTEGANGKNLGTADGNTPNMNHTHRLRYGSNNYAQGAIRQWLNSGESAGNVWKPQTKFDRPPLWAHNRAGFMAGLPADFLDTVVVADIPCCTNAVFECSSLDGTTFTVSQNYQVQDKFFLLSRPEVDGSWDRSATIDGQQLAFFKGLSTTEKIMYSPSGTASPWGLRTPYNGTARSIRMIHNTGVINALSGFDSKEIVPACIIA